MSADKNKKPDDAAEKPKGGKKKLILIGAIALVVLGGGGGAAWFFLGRSDPGKHGPAPKTAEIPKPAQYFPLDPALVVNLNGATEDGPQYLQVEIQLVTRDAEDLKAITDNAPALRAHLLMLLSQVKAADIADLAGKQKLQKSALTEAQRIMTVETGKKSVDDLLFTSFVTQ
ncbi:flagellar basal body protein FliL [Xanthomonas sp. Kuri4-1]